MVFFRSAGSQSATISAGLSGISAAGAEAHSNGNNVNSESHSLSFGQATATSFGTVENGQAISGAASSVGASQSVAASGGNRGQSFSKAVGVQYQNRPVWNNVGPNYWRNGTKLFALLKLLRNYIKRRILLQICYVCTRLCIYLFYTL